MSRPFIPALAGWGILPPMRASLSLLLVAACLMPSPGATEDAGLSSRDHDRVRAAVARGEMVPLETVLADAQRRHAGTILEVELEGNEYEVELLGDDGVIRELEYDARTGELLEVEIEGD